jgi:4-aminobutyrate aminotransferase-like enzyme
MIVTDHAYHGTSWAISQITTCYETNEKRGDNIVTIPSPDSYRGRYANDAKAAEKYAGHVSEAIETLALKGHRPAALIVDTVFSNEGLPLVPDGFLSMAVEIVQRAGGLFVADEVQAGFGRLGTKFWGFATHDVMPDIVTMGKPMGNGYPVSAVVTGAEVVDAFQQHAHYFNTFAGNPVACSAAMAVLDVIDDEDLQNNALEVGNYIMDGLKALAKRHSLIGDLRGSGLFIGIDLVEDRDSRRPATQKAQQAVNLLKDKGVLIGSTGPFDNVLKIRPPIVFSRDNADFLLTRIDEVLDHLQNG